jgi:hypothetical protein
VIQEHDTEHPRIAVLVIGSLFWRNDGIREKWRSARLRLGEAVAVKVPIRYGRLSANGTYTMCFTSDLSTGSALLIPCKERGANESQMQQEAQALWGAERKHEAEAGIISANWGCVGAIFRDPARSILSATQWSQFFRKAVPFPVALVSPDGILPIAWPMRTDGTRPDFDVLLASANKPASDTPSPEGIAEAWMQQKDTEEYFFLNVKNGIRTADDLSIWEQMETRPGWIASKESRYADVMTLLRQERLDYEPA